MFIRNLNLVPFFFPDDIDSTGDDIALLDKLIDGKEGKEEEDELEDDKDTKDDLVDLVEEEPELDLDDKDDKEEKSELNEEDKELEINSARGLDFKKLREKFPDFVKTDQFKLLRDSYFRESKYTELFATVEDATEAAENNETFLKINNELLNNGSIEGLLTSVKEANPEALKKISSSFLETLNKIDDKLYIETITPVVKNLARKIFGQGRKALGRDENSAEGKALVATAKNIWQWAFPDDEADSITHEDRKEDTSLSDKEKELNAREQKIAEGKYTAAFQTAYSSKEKHLNKLIGDSLSNLKVNDFTKNLLIEKINAEIEKQVTVDSSHNKRMQSLWKRAESEGFSNTSLSRIVSAYLERARPILPAVRAKFLKLVSGKEDKVRDKEDNTVRLPRSSSGRAASNDGKTNIKLVDPKRIDYRNTSDEDILGGKVKLKA